MFDGVFFSAVLRHIDDDEHNDCDVDDVNDDGVVGCCSGVANAIL